MKYYSFRTEEAWNTKRMGMKLLLWILDLLPKNCSTLKVSMVGQSRQYIGQLLARYLTVSTQYDKVAIQVIWTISSMLFGICLWISGTDD